MRVARRAGGRVMSTWRLVDVDTVAGDRLEGVDVRCDASGGDVAVEPVVYGSVYDVAAATGGCHVEANGAVVTVRVDGTPVDRNGDPLPRWLTGCGRDGPRAAQAEPGR